MRKKRLTAVFVIFTIGIMIMGVATPFIPIFNPSMSSLDNLIQPVQGAEEEEIDNFDTVPTWRWTEIERDASVTAVLDSGYSIINANQDSSSPVKWEESRSLNSRDFDIDSRFQVNTHDEGNLSEFYRDMRGDPLDFNDDLESDMLLMGASTGAYHLDTIGVFPASGSGSYYYGYSLDDGSYYSGHLPSYSLFSHFEIRFKTSFDPKIKYFIGEDNDDFWNAYKQTSFNEGEPNVWQIMTFTKADFTFETLGTDDIYTFRFDVYQQDDTTIASGELLYIDYIKAFFKSEQFSFTSNEITGIDTVDFSDSFEYFDDETDNVADFNDGTTESYVGVDTAPVVAGYNLPDVTGAGDFTDHANLKARDSVNAYCVLSAGNQADFEYTEDWDFAIPTLAKIDGIEVRLRGYSTSSTNVEAFVRVQRASGGWKSTGSTQTLGSTGHQDYTWGGATNLWGTTWTPAQINDNANFEVEIQAFWTVSGTYTVWYDCVEVRVWYSYDTNVAHSTGWLDASANQQGEVEIERTSMSIDSSVYDKLQFEMYWTSTSTAVLTDLYIYDSGSNQIAYDGTNYAETTYHLLEYDLGLDADWTGTETTLNFRFIFTATDDFHVYLNMTYLKDMALSDEIESITTFSTSVQHYYQKPNGTLTFLTDNNDAYIKWGAYATTPTQINPLTHDYLETRIFNGDSSSQSVYLFYYNSTGDILTSGAGELVGSISARSWSTLTLNLSTISSWTSADTIAEFRLDIGSSTGDYYEIDYVLLLGDGLTNSGFKFSFLDSSLNETAFIGFEYHNATHFNWSFALNDILYQPDLIYEELFVYQGNEWLRFDLNMDLDKREIRFVLTYDNGSEIVEAELYDLFPTLSRPEPVIFATKDFPRLCINASTDPFTYINPVIGFIVAPWKLLDWYEFPYTSGSPDYTPPALIWLRGSEVSWYDSYSPYGFYIDEAYWSVTGARRYCYYGLDISRFDGVSFTTEMRAELVQGSWSIGDGIAVHYVLYNVLKNGSMLPVISAGMSASRASSSSPYWNEHLHLVRYPENSLDYEFITAGGITAYTDADGELGVTWSFYVDYELNKVIGQWKSDMPVRPEAEYSSTWEELEFTREWYLIQNFLPADNGGTVGNEQRWSAKMSGFQVTRKDILGDVVGAILNPVGDFLSSGVDTLLTPLMIGFQMLGLIFRGVGEFIVLALAPLFGVLEQLLDAISAGIAGLASAVWSFFSGALSSMQSTLSGLASAVWTFFQTAMNDLLGALQGLAAGIWSLFETALGNLLSAVQSLAAGIITALINTMTDVIDALWTALGNFLTEAGAWFLDIIELILEGLIALAQWIWDVIAGLTFFFWDLIGLPDLLALLDMFLPAFFDIIFDLPQFILDLNGFLFYYAFPGFLCFVWFIIAFINALRCESPADWLQNLIDYLLKDVSFNLSFLGNNIPHIPLGIFILPLTLFTFLTGTIFWIW